MEISYEIFKYGLTKRFSQTELLGFFYKIPPRFYADVYQLHQRYNPELLLVIL